LREDLQRRVAAPCLSTSRVRGLMYRSDLLVRVGDPGRVSRELPASSGDLLESPTTRLPGEVDEIVGKRLRQGRGGKARA